ncbi:MAG TPA: SAM-dependent methyltransferase, partial [Thermomonas sp.]|nr:SAM-dependent methyltransferase [Thermomonas sp.]
NQWLEHQDAHRTEVMAILRDAHGDAAGLWYQRWRMFWMACAELFGYADGQQWLVSHYLFERR